MRLRPFFSPLTRRVFIVLPPFALAAFRVAARRCSGRITIPLPSDEGTSRCPSVHATGTRARVEGLDVARGTLGEPSAPITSGTGRADSAIHIRG